MSEPNSEMGYSPEDFHLFKPEIIIQHVTDALKLADDTVMKETTKETAGHPYIVTASTAIDGTRLFSQRMYESILGDLYRPQEARIAAKYIISDVDPTDERKVTVTLTQRVTGSTIEIPDDTVTIIKEKNTVDYPESEQPILSLTEQKRIAGIVGLPTE